MALATPRRSGIATFAGVLLLLAGAFNLLDGIVAITDDTRYSADELLFGSLTAWGIWWLSTGAILLVAGVLVLRRSVWGLVFGVTLAGFNALSQLVNVGAQPGWALAAIVVDGLVIAVLSLHIDEFLE
jgi:hypothetical protein